MALSSAEAELGCVIRGSGQGLGYQALLKDLGIEVPLRVWTDSTAAIGGVTDFYKLGANTLVLPTASAFTGNARVLGGALRAAMGLAWWRAEPGLQELLITLFLFITAPVSANLMAQAALHLNLPSRAGSPPPAPPPL